MSNLDRITARDFETLSAFLDGELSAGEAERVQARLDRDLEFKRTLDELRQASEALASLPQIQAPRNFTLSERMAAVKPRSRAYPLLQLSTALAGLAFIVVVGADLLTATGARGTAMLADTETSAESAQRAAESGAELPLAAEQEFAAAPAAEPETGDEMTAETQADQLAEAEPQTEEIQEEQATPSGEARALAEQPEQTAQPEAGTEGAIAATPEPQGTPELSSPEEDQAQLGAGEAPTAEPTPDERTAKMDSTPEPGPEQIGAAQPEPTAAITPLRAVELGLGLATLLLLGLTLWLRARG